jgi:sugar O-acyltransferase (sialic acid O-acetyltransferase NeuD family)
MILTVDAPSRLRNRLIVFNRLKKYRYNLINYISPLAEVSPSAKLGTGNLIFPFTYIGPDARIGNANFIRQNTYLGHDSILEDGSTLASGCTLAGFCHIGNSCFLGINATVLPYIKIATETLIGAGSVVTKNTEPCTVYIGNPARSISKHEKMES